MKNSKGGNLATYSDPTIVQLSDKPRVFIGAWLFLAAGIVSVLGAGWFFFQTNRTQARTADLTVEIAKNETTLKGLEPTAVALTELDKTAQNLHYLFDGQKRWEAVLGTVEQRLYKNMVVTSLQFSDKGDVTFTANTPDYLDYAKIFRTLTDADGQKYFSVARPTAIRKVEDEKKGTSEIQFSFTLVLQKQVTNAQVTKFLTDLTTPAQ